MSLDLTLKNRELNFKVTNSSQFKVYEFEDFRLEAATKLLYRGGEPIDLTPKAVETLIALIESEGKIIGKDDLMQSIWADTVVEESNLAQYLHVLRKTLGKTPEGKPYIETFKRRGYRFNGRVRVLNSEARPLGSANNADEFIRSETAPPMIARSAARGNVRVIGNVAVNRDAEGEVNVGRTDNIYSVPGWVREPAADTESPAAAFTRPRWLLPLSLLILAGVSVAVGYGIYKSATKGEPGGARGIPFQGSDITRLTTTGRSKRAAISPDGRYVAHVTETAEGESLSVRQVAVANDTRIAGPVTSNIVWITFSPDGDYLYYLSLDRDKGDSELFRVPVLGGPIVKVAHDVGAPSVSPDGTRLAYMVMNQEESRLIVASFDSANAAGSMSRNAPDHLYENETVLASRYNPDYLNMFWYAPAWSLDGKSIAFPVNQSDEKGRYETVLAIDVETRAERKLTDTRWQQVGQPRWLADGIVVTASESSTAPLQLWHISLQDGKASRITRDINDYQDPSITSDGKTLAVIENRSVSNIWTLGNDELPAKRVMSEAGRFNEIVWLPDGRIAYTSNAGGSSDIWTANADGSNVRQLTVDANARLGLAITADEKQLVFAGERDGRYNLWRVNIDGSEMTRITNGEGEYYPQCTPDGRWIVYQSGANYPTLWKIPFAGGEAIPITKTTASRPSISPDGRFVAYHYLDSSLDRSRWGIGITRLEDGVRVKRFDFPPTVVERLVKWTRDDSGIAFLNSPGGIPNIWTQPLDGGPPRPITDFPSDNIIAFNWNADGSQLVVIRGVETSDVLLINRQSGK